LIIIACNRKLNKSQIFYFFFTNIGFIYQNITRRDNYIGRFAGDLALLDDLKIFDGPMHVDEISFEMNRDGPYKSDNVDIINEEK